MPEPTLSAAAAPASHVSTEEALAQRSCRVLYVSTDGVLQHLGESQIVAVLEGLAARGWAYRLLTLEREEDLWRRDAVERMEQRLGRAGIEWRRLPYRVGGARGMASNFTRLAAAVWEASRGVSLLHARSYQAAAACRVAGRAVPYLFDTRGYWIDERAEDGRWFASRPAYRAGKAIERMLYEAAAGAVMLSAVAAEDVRVGRLGRWPADRPVEEIPTVTDYARFGAGAAAPRIAELVVGYVGSVNSSYRLPASLDLFRRVLSRRPTARLLCLTGQPAAMREAIARSGVPTAATEVATVPYAEVPGWLLSIDWGLLLLKETPAKRASMPTKLGEFFASGVRPIQHGCNPDVRAWVERSGLGLVLEDLSDASLDAAADVIATSSPVTPEEREAVRRVTRPHFGLAEAIERYAALLTRVVLRSVRRA